MTYAGEGTVSQERGTARVKTRQVYERRGYCAHYYSRLLVVCRYPLDPEDAPPRWIVEQVSSVSHLLVVPEATLLSVYELCGEQA